MTRTTFRLTATIAMSVATIVLAPAAASAHSSSPSVMEKMRGHATMADALRSHPEIATMDISGMHMAGGKAATSNPMMAEMMAKMRGHATMADALRSHPEIATMDMSCMDMASGGSMPD